MANRIKKEHEFKPPMSERTTEELISIAHASTFTWTIEAIEAAQKELIIRGVTIEEQNKILDSWEVENRLLEKEFEEQWAKRETEKYTIGKMLLIFVLAPFILGGRLHVGLSLPELKEENFKIKFKQRLFLLVMGSVFWIIVLVSLAENREKMRLQEIENYQENHIDKYEVQVDSLLTLPDGFYAFRRGNIFFSSDKYMIWYTLDNSGNVEYVFEISDSTNEKMNGRAIIQKYNIDTTGNKIVMQRFIDLSRKYKFGHIKVDKANKVSFSYRDGLEEQFVLTLNDSLKNNYLNNFDFKLLRNGWFEFIGK